MFRVRTTVAGSPGGTYLSTFYFDELGGGDAADAVAATVDFWNNIKPVIWNGLVMTVEPEVATISEGTGQITGVISTGGGSATGNDTGDPAPWATQGLIRWRTGIFLGGREIRGRTFVPGVTELSNSAGIPTSGYRSAVQSAVTSLLGDADAALVIWSKKNGDTAPAISGTPWTKFAVLRSRRD